MKFPELPNFVFKQTVNTEEIITDDIENILDIYEFVETNNIQSCKIIVGDTRVSILSKENQTINISYNNLLKVINRFDTKLVSHVCELYDKKLIVSLVFDFMIEKNEK